MNIITYVKNMYDPIPKSFKYFTLGFAEKYLV